MKEKENNLGLYVSGLTSKPLLECLLLDVNDKIENHAADYNEQNLALLKYERISYIERLFGE